MSFQYSKDGKYFAQLSTDGKLKVWDTLASKFEQEFTPDFHLTSPCTCLHFIQPTNSSANKSGSPRKKVKRRDSLNLSSPYIILGTRSGVLLIYSIAKGDVEYTIKNVSGQSINCLSWYEGTNIFSAADQNVICWDLQNKSIKSKWKTGNEKTSAILVIPNSNNLLTASKNIKLWDIDRKEILKTFVGHSSEISILEYVGVSKGDYFISASKADRILSCWNLSDSSKNAVSTFLMEDVAYQISLNSNDEGVTNMVAVTRNGVAHLYQHSLNGKNSKPIKPKMTLQIASDSSGANNIVTPIPIVSVVLGDELSMSLCYGTDIILVFENVVLITSQKTQCLIRKDPRNTKKSRENELSKIKTPFTNNAQYLTPHTNNGLTKRKADGTREVPMEKRLENLTLNKLDGESAVPKVNNVAQLLLQGLHSKDKKILKSVLSRRDEEVIKNTVKRLPMTVIVPLINELTIFIQGKTLLCQTGAVWLKCLLQVHAGLLVSNPELSDILSPIMGSIESRLSLHTPLNSLRGRLDLLVSQVGIATQATIEDEEPLLVYNDKDSSDSDGAGVELGNSDSDDDWLEDDTDEQVQPEENGDNNSDEEMST